MVVFCLTRGSRNGGIYARVCDVGGRHGGIDIRGFPEGGRHGGIDATGIDQIWDGVDLVVSGLALSDFSLLGTLCQIHS
jgi:hypothetical protein